MVTARKQSDSLGEHREAFDARNKDLPDNEDNKGWIERRYRLEDTPTLEDIVTYVQRHAGTVPLNVFQHYARAMVETYDRQWGINTCYNKLLQALGYANYDAMRDAIINGVIPNLNFNPDTVDTREFYLGVNSNQQQYVRLLPSGSDMTGNIPAGVENKQRRKQHSARLRETYASVEEIKFLVDRTPSFSRKEFKVIRNQLTRTLVLTKVPEASSAMATALMMKWIGQPGVSTFQYYDILPNRCYNPSGV